MFTDFRRELIARTLFDLLKIGAAAAFASKFFLGSPRVVKWIMGLLLVVLTVMGISVCPPKKPKE